MCQIENKRIKIKEDLVCYKVEKHAGDDWVTAYREACLNRNKVIKAKGFSLFDSKKKIKRGYFHSFTNLEDAKKELLYMSEMFSWPLYRLRITECIIPKGTKTYLGKFNYSYSYASRKIILTNKVFYKPLDGEWTIVNQ